MKRYKTVAGPQGLVVKKGKAQEAFDLFAELINANAKDGWEYHSMEQLTIAEKAGCLFGQPEVNYYYMLIFVKDE